MDTTYWGRNFGVIVFKDARTKRILWTGLTPSKESPLLTINKKNSHNITTFGH